MKRKFSTYMCPFWHQNKEGKNLLDKEFYINDNEPDKGAWVKDALDSFEDLKSIILSSHLNIQDGNYEIAKIRLEDAVKRYWE